MPLTLSESKVRLGEGQHTLLSTNGTQQVTIKETKNDDLSASNGEVGEWPLVMNLPCPFAPVGSRQSTVGNRNRHNVIFNISVRAIHS